jgi:hypothetical protein
MCDIHLRSSVIYHNRIAVNVAKKCFPTVGGR